MSSLATSKVSQNLLLRELLQQAGSFPYGIAAGPDGAVWFTEPQGNRVGRVTNAGVIAEYSFPTAMSFPVGIATGPDGGIWFAEFSVDKIAELEEPTLVPTLSGWGMLAAALLLAAAGLRMLQTRPAALRPRGGWRGGRRPASGRRA